MASEDALLAHRSAVPKPLLWGTILFLAAAPCVLALATLGRIQPDENYQVLEPALYCARGYGMLAFEWRIGLRNWSLPFFFAGIIRLCDRLGIRDPLACRAVMALPLFLLHLGLLCAVYRYARRRIGAPAAYLALLAVGLYGFILQFAGRTMSETFSSAFLVMAVDALDACQGRWRVGAAAAPLAQPPRQAAACGLLAGLMLGMAVVTRYASLYAVIAVVIWLVMQRYWRLLRWSALAGLLVAAGLGMLDWLTWGGPFHSLLLQARFHALAGAEVQHIPVQTLSYYLKYLPIYLPLWAWIGVVVALRRFLPRLPLGLFCAAIYWIALFLTPHKEPRYLYPGVLLILLDAAPGIVDAIQRLPRRGLRVACVSGTLAMSLVSVFLHRDMKSDEYHAILLAARPPEVTGLLALESDPWDSAGYFYLGKNIPWIVLAAPAGREFQQALADPRINRAITRTATGLAQLRAVGFHEIDRVGSETILAR